VSGVCNEKDTQYLWRNQVELAYCEGKIIYCEGKIIYKTAQHGSTGVVHSLTWSTLDVSPGSRDGSGRGEVGGELKKYPQNL